MRLKAVFCLALLASAVTVEAQAASDTYRCPSLAQDTGAAERATGVDVYSGHPSEMGHLKPDNDDNGNGPDYWILGSPKFDYWYVCQYKKRGEKREFKLDRAYARCTAVRAGKYFDKLVCQD